MANKTKVPNAYVIFQGGSMKTIVDNEETTYLKMFPAAQDVLNEQQEWTGTGFALNNGYVVTNYHVIEGARSIQVQGVNGNLFQNYDAVIVTTDKRSDLAILRITDSRFTGFDNIPYSVKTSLSDVGENIFVLGYPLTNTMGNEIKLTDGIISSKTGYQGDISLYQISAPVQPGNSGGPLFDKNGNVIGIVSAKHKGAENVGYAIKTSYLKNLAESSVSEFIFPQKNSLYTMSLPEKVKKIKDFVFIIQCSNSSKPSVAISSSNSVTVPATPTPPVTSTTPKTNSNDIIIQNPQISSMSDSSGKLKILSVHMSTFYTTIELEFYNQSGTEQISVAPTSVIISYNTGEKYKLTRAEGIPVEPNRYHFIPTRKSLRFKLIFPALLKSTTQFNLEMNTSNQTYRFYGVKLRE